MRYLVNSTVLGYQPLATFVIDDDDAEALALVDPYVQGEQLTVIEDEPEPDVDVLALAEPVLDPTPEQIGKAKADDLRGWLETRGLDTSGKVGELRDRLAEALAPPEHPAE